MSVANELTGEVAVFLLKNENLNDPRQTQQVLLTLQATLRRLSLEARHRRRAKLSAATQPSIKQSASSAGH